MKFLTHLSLIAALSLLLTPALRADDIPDRPEKLAYPPFKYEPPAAEQYRVPLKSGPIAYLIPDHERPLVSLTVYIRTGKYLAPADKAGLAQLTGWLLAHGGAGTNTADQLEERLAFLAANLDTDIDDNQGTVSLSLLSKDLDQGLDLLQNVLFAPRFEDAKLTLRKSQILQDLAQRNDDSEAIETRETSYLARGDQFYVNHYTTSNSLANITPLDIEKFHYAWFWPSNFVVAVSGDFDRDNMIARLEQLFSHQPENVEMDHLTPGGPPPPIPTNYTIAAPGLYFLDKPEVDQGRVTLLLPGILRTNPDYYALLVMNDILGGGGFSSRLMGRVRSDEGLAYDIHSISPGGIYYPGTFSIGYQSKSRTVAYAAQLTLEEIKKMINTPVSDQELNIAKRSFIDSFPHTFATKDAVAAQFARDEFTGRLRDDPEFWQNFRAKIQAVTQADIQRVAQKYLLPDQLVVLIVGNEKDILLGHPSHPVDLKTLFGAFHELPQRDPYTLQPLPPAK
jgi:predicted Zn-dependent peptidase